MFRLARLVWTPIKAPRGQDDAPESGVRKIASARGEWLHPMPGICQVEEPVHPFSGFLFCGVCGGPMIVPRGSTKYVCLVATSRGTCSNHLSVKASTVTSRLLRELGRKVAIGQKLANARKRVEAHLKKLSDQEGLGMLPSADQVLKQLSSLEEYLSRDPQRGREMVRRIFKDVRITLTPQSGGFYLARTPLLPLVLLDDSQDDEPTRVMGKTIE
jgi:hypothetical protein